MLAVWLVFASKVQAILLKSELVTSQFTPSTVTVKSVVFGENPVPTI